MTSKDVARIIASEINSKSSRVTAIFTDDGKVVLHPKRTGSAHGLLSSTLLYADRSTQQPLAPVEESNFTGGETVKELKLIGNEGDTFFQRWDSIKTQPRSSDDTNQVLDGMSVMLESHINLEARNDIDRGTTRLTDILYENFGNINPVFSQPDDFLSGSVLPEKLDLDSYGNFITWSMQKSAGDDIDEWAHVTLASSLGLDGDKGKVNSLRRFNNSIISFQDKGIAEILFNSRTQISTQEGVPIEIANSGKVDGKRYISNKYGSTNRWSIVEGKTGLFFIDNLNKTICLFNGEGIESISTKANLDAWVRANNTTDEWNPVDDNNFVAYYDKIHSDVYFVNSRNAEQPTLVYSETLGGFSGFFDYAHVPMMTNVSDRFVSFNDGRLWLQNEGGYCDFFGEKKPFWITWRVAPDNFSDKIWTNLEYRADFLGVLTENEDGGKDEPLVYDRYAFRDIEKLDDYSYAIRYGKLDYAFAYEYFRTRKTDYVPGGCTSVRVGNLYAKNHDWLYSNQVDFFVRTANTYGFAGSLSSLNKAFVENRSNYSDDLYRILPFCMNDGVNKYGISANINVIHIEDEYGITTGTVPDVEQRVELCSLMVVRYVLDHFKTATEAVEFLRDYASIYVPQTLTDMGYESHWMIADKNKSYVVECINNHVEIIESPVLTNFYLYDVEFNSDGLVNSIGNLPGATNHITPYGQGLERFNTVKSAIGSIDSVDSLRELMSSIFFTNAYDISKQWRSEFTGDELTVDSPVLEFRTIMQEASSAFESRDRNDPKTWQTTHSSVYDLDNMTLNAITQEQNGYNFALRNRTDVREWEYIDGDEDTFYTDNTFDELTVWNEYQTTGDVHIPSRSFQMTADMYPDADRKFRMWRMDIPRAKKDVTSGNRFGIDRIRNPWVFVKLKKNIGNFEHDMMQLHDVIVKYFIHR